MKKVIIMLVLAMGIATANAQENVTLSLIHIYINRFNKGEIRKGNAQYKLYEQRRYRLAKKLKNEKDEKVREQIRSRWQLSLYLPGACIWRYRVSRHPSAFCWGWWSIWHRPKPCWRSPVHWTRTSSR